MKNEPSRRTAPSQEEIARRAYALWQDAGSPGNASQDHWLQAERELTGPARFVPPEAASTTPYGASGSSSISGQGSPAGGSGRS